MNQEAHAQPFGSIDFIDLKAQQDRISAPLKAAIDGVLAHGRYIMGPEIGTLETNLSEFCGAKHTITCSSGTDALTMALMALGVKPGDAVFVPSFTFASTAESVAFLGATPVFVDVNENDYNLSIESLESAYASIKDHDLKLVGIIPVDLFGLSADYDAIKSFADAHNLWIIADAAQSWGATYKDKNIGQLGNITTTSFFPAKPLGCYGDGGAICTDDDLLAEKMRSIRVHGKGSDKYDNVRLGINGRLDTLQAAILIEKLKIFADEVQSRQRVAQYYNEHLENVIKTPIIEKDRGCAWAQYTLDLGEAGKREAVQATLKAGGIPTAVYYPLPLHLQTCYKDYPSAPDMSVSENLSQRVFSLPMHPYLETDIQDHIIETLKRALS